MLSSSKIKWLKSLSQKKVRRQEGLFIAEGEKIVSELLDSPWEVLNVFALEGWEHPLIKDKSIPYQTISEKELERISSLTTPNKVLAVVKIPPYHAGDINLNDNITLLLEDIQDPGNLGTIIRTAEWFGITNIVCSPQSADVYNHKVIQATMGSFIRTRIYYAPIEEFLLNIPQSLPVMGAMLDGENIFKKALTGEGILIIGNESKGISKAIQRFITQKLYIPRANEKSVLPESLNASVATAIILAQIVR